MAENIRVERPNQRILITGVSGFIGRVTVRLLAEHYHDITALIRPGTKPERLNSLPSTLKYIHIDLSDIKNLNDFLEKNRFDTILHIGALRGGRKFNREQFYTANVAATETMVANAMKNNTRLIFCSSVGVFGAAPLELPATNQTERQHDNFYHTTKIHSEAIIEKAVIMGLNAVIVRPSITYGPGDFGFPYTLVKLVSKHWMLLPDKLVWIHLTNVNLLAQVFCKLVEQPFIPGAAYNVADREPVKLNDLVDFISQKIHGKKYPHHHVIDLKFFRWGETIAGRLHNELWVSRFNLLSRSWMYDVHDVYHDLKLPLFSTIPMFESVIDWYKKKS